VVLFHVLRARRKSCVVFTSLSKIHFVLNPVQVVPWKCFGSCQIYVLICVAWLYSSLIVFRKTVYQGLSFKNSAAICYVGFSPFQAMQLCPKRSSTGCVAGQRPCSVGAAGAVEQVNTSCLQQVVWLKFSANESTNKLQMISSSSLIT